MPSLGKTLSGLRATDANFAYAYGNLGALATTSNGGVTWTPLSIPSSNTVEAASFADDRRSRSLSPDGTGSPRRIR